MPPFEETATRYANALAREPFLAKQTDMEVADWLAVGWALAERQSQLRLGYDPQHDQSHAPDEWHELLSHRLFRLEQECRISRAVFLRTPDVSPEYLTTLDEVAYRMVQVAAVALAAAAATARHQASLLAPAPRHASSDTACTVTGCDGSCVALG